MSRRVPPTMARRLIEWAVRPEDRRYLLNDLHEEFDQIARTRSPGAARRWYWAQTVRSMVPALTHRMRNRAHDGWATDLRQAVRYLRRRPGLTITTVGVLSVGIGATTAIFALLHHVVLRPLPFPDPHQLVMMWERNAELGFEADGPSPGNLRDWEERSETLSSMAGWFLTSGTYRGEDDVSELRAAQATEGFFQTIDVPAAIGRTFQPDETTRNGPAVVLSHRTWLSVFDGDSAVVGSSISLSSNQYVVVGVMPPRFAFPDASVEIWISWDLTVGYGYLGGPPRDWRFMQVVGRIAPDHTIETAQREMQRIAADLERDYPATNNGWTVTMTSLHDETVGDAQQALLLVFAAVGLLLLMTCANVANILLARAPGRARELAMRTALGANSARLVRQLLTETLVLGTAGAIGGTGVAILLTRTITTLGTGRIPRIETVTPDWTIAFFAAAVAVGTGLICGVGPAAYALRNDVADTMRQTGNTRTTGGRGLQRATSGLVVSEVAIATLLMVGAGWFGSSFLRLTRVDLGFDPTNVLTFRLSLDSRDQVPQTAAFYETLIQELRGVPGVVSAGASTTLPLSPVATGFTRPYRRVGERTASADAPKTQMRMVTTDFFTTLDIPVLSGTAFSGVERADGPRVAVVNRMLARQLFGDETAVDRSFMIDFGEGWTPYRILGVVGDVSAYGIRNGVRPTTYLSHVQVPYLAMNVFVRTATPPAQTLEPVRAALQRVAPTQPAHMFDTLDRLRRNAVGEERLLLVTLAVFAAISLLLAASGVYGVISYAVSRRTQEIGLRLALGAAASRVTAAITGGALTLTAIGLLLGVVASMGVGRVLRAYLFHVQPADPIFPIAVSAVLLMISAASAFVPARRAGRVDPATALRAG